MCLQFVTGPNSHTADVTANLSWKLVNTDVILIISITVDIVPINYLD